MSTDPSTLAAARHLLRRSWQGVLSTLSVELDGAPFGSVASFSLGHDGRPLFLASGIAEHSRNLAADPRLSLIVMEGGDDVQSAGRLTLVGRAARLSTTEHDALGARHYRRFPQAEDYHRAHDFSLWRIAVEQVRFIGGFGRIHWIEPQALLQPTGFSETEERRMVEHMNSDHGDALALYCEHYAIDTGGFSPRLAAIDRDGFDLMLGKRLARIDFESPATTLIAVRQAMVALVRKAREPAAVSAAAG